MTTPSKEELRVEFLKKFWNEEAVPLNVSEIADFFLDRWPEEKGCCEKCYGRQGTMAGGGVYCIDSNCPCHSKREEKCVCGEQKILGGAEVEIGGVCHRPHNPCYVIAPSTTEEKPCKNCGSLEKFHPQMMNEYTRLVCKDFIPPTPSTPIESEDWEEKLLMAMISQELEDYDERREATHWKINWARLVSFVGGLLSSSRSKEREAWQIAEQAIVDATYDTARQSERQRILTLIEGMVDKQDYADMKWPQSTRDEVDGWNAALSSLLEKIKQK